MSYNIGETVWFDGTKWEIADGPFNGGYALWRKGKDGKMESYGWDNSTPDPLCPFFEGWVSPIYLGKVLTKERRKK